MSGQREFEKKLNLGIVGVGRPRLPKYLTNHDLPSGVACSCLRH